MFTLIIGLILTQKSIMTLNFNIIMLLEVFSPMSGQSSDISDQTNSAI